MEKGVPFFDTIALDLIGYDAIELKGCTRMLKKVFLALIIGLNMELVSYAVNWIPVGKPESRPQELINNFYKHLIVGDKTEVVEALRSASFKVYIDVDSITDFKDIFAFSCG